MGQLRRRCHQFTLSSATLTALAFLLVTSVSALSLNPTSRFTVVVRKEEVVVEGGLTLQRLGGPGSWPPTCRSKCGRCSPCKAVHVPIQPWLSIPFEYYPEAWRCKCGNNLFMP